MAKITLRSNGFYDEKPVGKIAEIDTTSYTFPDQKKYGVKYLDHCEFLGWTKYSDPQVYTDIQTTGDTISVTENVTYYPKWKIYNKIVFDKLVPTSQHPGGEPYFKVPLPDLTSDTIEASKVRQGKVFYDDRGLLQEGTFDDGNIKEYIERSDSITSYTFREPKIKGEAVAWFRNLQRLDLYIPEGMTTINISDFAFAYCNTLTYIRAHWQEGVVPGAPWGATFAEIVYNTQGDRS